MNKFRPYLLAAILGFGLLVLYGFRLDFPQKEYYDEIYHVTTAREYIALKGNTDTAHPPLGKVIMAGTIILGGDHSWVWRTSALAGGIFSILAFFYLSRKFFDSDWAAFLASSLLSLDGMTMTQSRIAMLNTPMLFFMLLSLIFFLKVIETNRWPYYLLTGICLGLTASTRWVGLGILPVLGMILAVHIPKIKKIDFILRSFFLILIPALIVYFAAHIILIYSKGFHWRDILLYQKQMFDYHSKLKVTHLYESQWWSWPVMIRPIWYFFESKSGIVNGILCVGNPAIFWMFFPALGYAVYHYLETRCTKTLFAIAGFFSQWLPWAFISRCKFFHYFHPAVPFEILIITIYLKALWNRQAPGKTLAAFYIIFVIGMFIYWYPLYNGYPISDASFKNHMWFKNWI